MNHIKQIIFSISLLFIPMSLFSDSLNPSYYIQSDKSISIQAMTHNEKDFFNNNTSLRKAILPESSLWIKVPSSDHLLLDPLLPDNTASYHVQKYTYYHIQDPSLSLLISLETLQDLNHNSLVSWISINAFYYGTMFAFLLYLWLLYSFFRHKSFLYYLYFHLFFLVLLLDTDGWLQLLIWHHVPILTTITTPLFLGLTMLLMVLFTRKLLATENGIKILDRTLIGFATLNVIAIPITFFVSQELVMPIITVLSFATSFMMLLVTLYTLKLSESINRKSDLIIWIILLLAIMVEYLRYNGILPTNLITLLVLKVTLFLELVIISLTLLSHRMRFLEDEQKIIKTHLSESKSEFQKVDQERERLQHKHDLLNKLAGVDGLTGLYNRREFINLSESLIFKTNSSIIPCALMMLDLDHFKHVNDTYGHDAGDIVLKDISTAISLQMRTEDIFGRIGGEEFAIFMPEITVEEANTIANKVCKTVSELKIETETATIPITTSIGLTIDMNHRSTLSELMKSSDLALYEAKEKGRNRVVSVEALPR